MRLAATAFALTLAFATSAAAGNYDNPVLKKECGSCHMAFDPGSLSRASWKLILDGMSNHFGEDASMGPAARAAIEEILMANAADARTGTTPRYVKGPKGEPTPIRISDTWGWQKQHKGVKDWQFSSTKVKSRGNCVACHPKAEQGVWED